MNICFKLKPNNSLCNIAIEKLLNRLTFVIEHYCLFNNSIEIRFCDVKPKDGKPVLAYFLVNHKKRYCIIEISNKFFLDSLSECIKNEFQEIEKYTVKLLELLIHELTHVEQYCDKRNHGTLPSDSNYYNNPGELEAHANEIYKMLFFKRLFKNYGKVIKNEGRKFTLL